MDSRKLIVRSTLFFQMGFAIEGNKLTQVFLSDLSTTKPKNNQIYLATIEDYNSSIGCFILNLKNGIKALLSDKEQKFYLDYYGKKFHLGQKILVQIIREETTGKMPLVSVDIAIHGFFLTYKPLLKSNIISKNIVNDVQELLKKELLDKQGFIIRSTYKGQNIDALKIEIKRMENLLSLFLKEQNIGPLHTYSFIEDVLLFQINKLPKEIIYDGDFYNEFKDTLKVFSFLNVSIKPYAEKTPVLNFYDIQDYEEKILSRKLSISNEINLDFIINSSFNYVDVNFKGDDNMAAKEEAFYKVNLLALPSIAENIILRDLSGQIFIDVLKIKNKQYKNILLNKLQGYFNNSVNKFSVLGFSNLGLIEVSRQKFKDSIPLKITSNNNYYYFTLINQIKDQIKQDPLTTIKIYGNKEGIGQFKIVAGKDLAEINAKLSSSIVYYEDITKSNLHVSFN